MELKKILIIATILCFSANICSALAYDMSSDNYKLQIEGIDMGAIGQMKDFSNVRQGLLSESTLREIFASHFSWKMALIFVAGFLTVFFRFMVDY